MRGKGDLSWRGEWQPTPVFLPGESHGQRRLAGYNHKELDMTEVTCQQQQGGPILLQNVRIIRECSTLKEPKKHHN